VDQGQGSSRLPSRGLMLAGNCRSCSMTQRVADCGMGNVTDFVAEDVDEDAVVLSGPEFDGLVVVPCQHIGGLGELSDPARAHVLAAIRRAIRSVRAGNPGLATRLVVVTDAASEGHVCFHVLPGSSDHPAGSASR
jgi:hypothetical protein